MDYSIGDKENLVYGKKNINHVNEEEAGRKDGESEDLSGLRKQIENELSCMYAIQSMMIEGWPNLISHTTTPALVEVLTDQLRGTYKHVALYRRSMYWSENLFRKLSVKQLPRFC